MCPQSESRGTSLEKISYRNIGVHHTKQGCFGRLTVRATCWTRNFFEKPCAIGEILIFTCFGPVLYEGSMEGVWLENADLWSTISISGRLVTRRGNFLQSHIRLITYYSLFGQLASRRPPDIGSVWCIPIFQVSNRTIGCILNRFARSYGKV